MEVMMEDPRRSLRRTSERRDRERRFLHLTPEEQERRNAATRRHQHRREEADRRDLP